MAGLTGRLAARITRLEQTAAGPRPAPVVTAALLAALAEVGIRVDPALLGATTEHLLTTPTLEELRLLERLVAGDAAGAP